MGFASMIEDFEKIREYNAPFHNAGHYSSVNVKKVIKKAIVSQNTVKKNSQQQEIRKQQYALQKQLDALKDSLRVRLNLAESAQHLSSRMTGFIVEGLIEDIQKAINEVNSAKMQLQFISMDAANNMSVSERISAKKIIIYQIIYQLVDIVNKSDVNIPEMMRIVADMKSLIGWFYIEDAMPCRVDKLECTRDQMLDYLKNELGFHLIDCDICSKQTIKEINYCINCGLCIGDLEDE